MRSAFRSQAKRVTATVPDAICQSRSVPLIVFGRRETRRTHDEKSREQRQEPAEASANGVRVLLTARVDRTRPIDEGCEARM